MPRVITLDGYAASQSGGRQNARGWNSYRAAYGHEPEKRPPLPSFGPRSWLHKAGEDHSPDQNIHLIKFAPEPDTTLIYKHYREIVVPEERQRYFSIFPPIQAEDVIHMAQASL